MEKLNFPEYDFKIITKDGKKLIFDEIRKKYIVLNSEEWVRQNLIKYLIYDREIPSGLISIEKKLIVNQMSKRTDIVIYNNKGQASMLAECKAPNILIDQKVFEQIARYNMTLKVPVLLVSNGFVHYCCIIDHNKKAFSFMNNIPKYTILCKLN